ISLSLRSATMSSRLSRLLLAHLLVAAVALLAAAPVRSQTTTPRPDPKRPADDTKKGVDDAKKFRESAEFQLKQKEYLEEQKKQGVLGLRLRNEELTTPPANDIEFPRNWRELSMKRQQINVTEKEKKILKALDMPIEIDLKDSTLQAVLSYLNDKTGLNL